MPVLWDPLTYKTLVAGTVAHFEKQDLEPLEGKIAVEGPGIYALYYRGKMLVYGPIADGNYPIYIGKAVPPGARKGSVGNVAKPALRNRLRQHRKSIAQASNLDIKDFHFRVLAIVPVWIVFAEQALIQRYHPVWNTCLEGFGKHDQGRNRAATMQSWWDTLHPGRPWAESAQQATRYGRTRAMAKERVGAHFAKYSIP